MRQPIKWHGGKHYLADKIIGLMPPRCQNPNAPAADDAGWLHYVEPFFGGGSVLLAQDPEGISEVVSDISPKLVNFWNVLADQSDFAEFMRIVEATPFCECEWARSAFAWYPNEGRAEYAARFFIQCRQSMSGRLDSFAPLTRNRTRRGMNEQASAWLSAVEGLPEVHARLKRVVILHGNAVEVIRQQDGPRTLFYLDPPYMQESRTAPEVYEHEMHSEQHRELLEALKGIKGRFVLSGYRCALYDGIAEHAGWNRIDVDIDNKSGCGPKKQKRVESIWRNYR